MSTAATALAPLPPAPPAEILAPPSAASTLHVVPSTDDAASRRERLDLDRLFDLSHPPGYYSELSRVALLRRTRRRPHDQLLVDFSASEVLTELVAGGRTLWCSDWTWQATVDGQPLAAAGAWREVCWHTDGEVDYLEIELPLSGGWCLERQLVLGRKDRFVFLADALLGPSSPHAPREEFIARSATPTIRYAATIPLAQGVQFSPADETREGWLTCGRQVCATVVPLALPEWRAERGHSELAGGNDGTLVLMQAAQGHALFAPLWIDLDPRRVPEELTWRRLTVAENLQNVPRDVAAGYRVQIGRGHWLVYRTLAPRGNRTVLGQNYSAEFVCARLKRTGAAEAIIEIQ